MRIQELTTKLTEVTEDYEVYSPSEEEYEAKLGNKVHRSKFNSSEIRNIMMSYFNGLSVQDVYDSIREHIDAMPDEWVIEFLTHQGDTKVNKIHFT